MEYKYKIFLATKSPRRIDLFSKLDIPFECILKENIDESYPKELKGEDIVIFLAQKKAKAYHDIVNNDENAIVITADTIVCLGDETIEKPVDKVDAIRILTKLSDKKHKVITAVNILHKKQESTLTCSTDVYFQKLKQEEINYYVDKYNPLDKAGAYGIQEWIGMIGINKIEGSYFNVMGLPVQLLYKELMNFNA